MLQAVQVPIPDLRGKTMADAQSTLEAAGFSFADGGVTDSEMPAGTVARTDPAGGTSASRGSTVTVFSSNGTQVVVPDVVGKSEAEARATLSGFAVTKAEQDVTDPKQVGVVLAMTPAAGTGSAPGGQVSITIGKLGAGNGNGKGNG